MSKLKKLTLFWGAIEVVLAVHDRQLAEHGGLEGVRDAGVIEPALSRPKNQAADSKPDAADLAACYAFGLAKNHGFNDGNKRTAWIFARLFLADNGFTLKFDPIVAIKMVQGLAAGEIGEEALAAWFRERLV